MAPLLDLIAADDFDRHEIVDVILHQSSASGLRDLSPNSVQLRRMASRARRQDVQYTTIVGTGSPVSPAQADRVRRMLQTLDGRSKIFRLIRPRIDPLVTGFDEIVRGKGDGVVAADHATIDDVEDIVTFDLAHGQLVRPLPGRTTNPVWDVIAERLQQVRQ